MTYPVLADLNGDFYSSYGRGENVFVFYLLDHEGIIRWHATQEAEDTLGTIQAEVAALLDE